MNTIFEVLLTQGGLLGALLVLALTTVVWQEKKTERLRILNQETQQAERAAAQKRYDELLAAKQASEDELLAELAALHEKHKQDQWRAAQVIQEVNATAAEAMQSLNDRVHSSLDRLGDLLEHTQSQRHHSHQLPPPRPIHQLPPRKTGR